MKKLQVRVTYGGKLNPEIDSELDKKIISAMKKAGCRWYAQGQDRRSGVRDIAFDLDIDPKKCV